MPKIRQTYNNLVNLEGEDLLAYEAEFKEAKTNKLNNSMEILTKDNKASLLSKPNDPPVSPDKLDTTHELLIAHNNKQLSASYLYKNYVSHKSEVESKLAGQIAMRYEETATCPEIQGLHTISYFFPLSTILNNSFSKTIRVSTIVVKACSHFLAPVGRKLKIMEHASHRTASLCMEGYKQVTNAVTTNTTTNTRKAPPHKVRK